VFPHQTQEESKPNQKKTKKEGTNEIPLEKLKQLEDGMSLEKK